MSSFPVTVPVVVLPADIGERLVVSEGAEVHLDPVVGAVDLAVAADLRRGAVAVAVVVRCARAGTDVDGVLTAGAGDIPVTVRGDGPGAVAGAATDVDEDVDA